MVQVKFTIGITRDQRKSDSYSATHIASSSSSFYVLFKVSSKGSSAFRTIGHHLSRNTTPVNFLHMFFPVIPILVYMF
jgi:hypothetical protein